MKPGRSLRTVWPIAAALLTFGTGLSVFTTWEFHRGRVEAADQRFADVIDNRTERLVERLRSFESVLLAERAAFELAPDMDLASFRRLYVALDVAGRHAGMQGLGWQARVPGNRVDEVVAEQRRDRPAFALRPTGRRDVHYVVLYNEPESRLARTWGVDTYDDATLRPYLDRAIDCACTTLSAPAAARTVASASALAESVEFTLLVPVYKSAVVPAGVTERRQQFLGWASSTFQAQAFVESLELAGPQVGLRVVDAATNSTIGASAAADGGDEAVREVEFGGRSWLVGYQRLAAFPRASAALPWAIFAGRFAVTCLFSFALCLAYVRLQRERHGADLAQDLAMTDPLTGLPNRRALFSWLDAAKPATDSVAALFVDLDDLKETNDRDGHDAGDELLRLVSTRLRDVVRPEDFVARIGGDEFVLIARNIRGGAVARLVQKRLDDSLAGREGQPRIAASVGCVVGPHAGESAESLLARADKAMYERKSERRTARVPDQPRSGEPAPKRSK